MKRLATLISAALILLSGAPLAIAQNNLFAPRVYVNNRAITEYELSQRIQFMRLLRAPGNIEEFALKNLIEDRLRLATAEGFGIKATPEQIQTGMEEFAGRANLTADQLVAALAQAGVEQQTLRDFVAAGMVWREVVRGKFGAKAIVSEAEIDRAIAGAGQDTVEYAQFLVANDRNADAELTRIRGKVDSCNDLYGIAKGLPEDRLSRETRPVAEVPQDIAQELARLDAGESSTALVRGGARVFLMLCARAPQLEEPLSRDNVRAQLVNRRLAAYADVYLADLRANAIIREP